MTGSAAQPPKDSPAPGDAPDAQEELGRPAAGEEGGSYWDRVRGNAPPVVRGPGRNPSHPPRPFVQPAHRAPVFVAGDTAAPRTGASTGLTLSTVVLFLCAALVIVGSLTPWVTLSVASLSVSSDGNQSGLSTLMGAGVNGWFTFVGGIALLLIGALMIASRKRALRQLALLLAVATLGLSGYDMARVAYKVSASGTYPKGLPSSVTRAFTLTNHLGVGFGLILLLAAALVAMFAAAAELRSA